MNFPISELENFYPGIKESRLQEEFDRYYHLQRLKGSHSEKIAERNFLEKLRVGTPLAYITNQAFFYNSWYYVNENVLIPRFESEGLIELVMKNLQGKRICEVGTGSGCLALSILKETQEPLEMTFVDLSEKALEVTQFNYHTHKYSFHPDHKVNFVLGDRLNNVNQEFDLIFSNPPYVKRSQIVHEITKKYEPDMALFLNDETYEQWFREFFESSKEMSPLLILEGHEYNLQDLAELARSMNYEKVEVTQDLNRRDRYLLIKF